MARILRNRLREIREDSGLTQYRCAVIAHISKNSYIRYENCERSTPLDIAVAFAKYYDVSVDYIAGLTEDKRKYWENPEKSKK